MIVIRFENVSVGEKFRYDDETLEKIDIFSAKVVESIYRRTGERVEVDGYELVIVP